MEPIFSVSEFNEMVSNHLTLLGEVTVEGELSEFKLSQGKWVYATLKDEEASVSLFGTAWQIRNTHSLDVGMKVKVTGVPSLYKKTARFSLNVSSIVPSGEGALRAAYEKLKSQLEAEGLFAPERKRPLPLFPETIGLLTAPGSQAYQDFVKVSSGRMGGFNIIFYPVNVQGQDAVGSVIGGIKYFNKAMDVDLIVVTRGGGSLEDLAAFNDEQLVREIFGSKIPTVCAIGHEGDVSLIELAADLRGSTPSNAAELIFPDRESVIREIDTMIDDIEIHVTDRIDSMESDMERALDAIGHFVDHSVELIMRCIHSFAHAHDHVAQEVDHTLLTLGEKQISLTRGYENALKLQGERIAHLEDKLRSLDPSAVLRRGFSILKDRSGKIVDSVSKIAVGETAFATVADGTIISKVEGVTKEIHEK